MLDTRQVGAMRAYAQRLLDTTCTVDRPTNTDGTWGQNSETFNNVATLVACAAHAMTPQQSIQALGGAGQIGAGVVGIVQGFTLWYTVGQDVRVNDRVTLANGLILRIQSTSNQQAEYFPLDSAYGTVAV